MATFRLRRPIVGLVILLSLLAACTKEPATPTGTDDTSDIEKLNVPGTFSYATSKDVNFSLRALDNQSEPIQGVRFDIYSADPEAGGALLSSGITGANGRFEGKLPLGDDVDSVFVGTDYLGLPNGVAVAVQGNSIQEVFGGMQPRNQAAGPWTHKNTVIGNGTVVNFLSPYTLGWGAVPTQLAPNDPISADFLSDVNASLPENRPVPQYNPEYLDEDNQTTMLITQLSDVWVTFVHEGAGHRNTLGFYTYTDGNAPATADDIDSIHIIFPNVSYWNSGGGLYSGNKVNIGRYEANTRIGWVLFEDAFRPTNFLNRLGQVTRYYSDKWLNPEPTPALRQHNALLADPGRNRVLMGFEDLNRYWGSDNDFNDAIFYVTANPVEAITYTDMPTLRYQQADGDGDGVPDNFDEYPSDPNRAFRSYFPTQNSFGTLAFEDLWPARGDYDFNDLVVNYQFTQVTNASNQVVELRARFVPTANGASFKNGFGFQFDDVPPSAIQSVTGHNLTENIISLAANGTEAGQNKATFIAFDNAWENFSNVTGSNPGNLAGINTSPGGRTGTPDTIELVIIFNAPVDASDLGLAPYNPFMIINLDRGKEVHLADMAPTALADPSLLGTQQDDSDPAAGRYYKTETNLPWAVHITEAFQHPVEKEQITAAYLFFGTWANSAGTNYKNWFRDQAGFRDNSKVFNE